MSRFVSKIVLIIFCGQILSCNGLRKGEIAKIQFHQEGCFGEVYSTMIFFEEKKMLFARLKENSLDTIVKLNNEHFKSLNEFIAAAKSLNEGNGCTSSRQYLIYTPKETFRRFDYGCQEIGFEKLRRIFLFLSNR